MKTVKADEIRKFMDQMKSDPNAAEYLGAYDKPDNELQAYAKIAAKLGYDLSEEDFREYIDAAVKIQKERTQEAAGKIEELPDDAMERVAGGKDHSNCIDTYKDRENCWLKDGCDIAFVHYDQYVCHVNKYSDPCHETAKPCPDDRYCDHTITSA